jgi:hypothetical protein
VFLARQGASRDVLARLSAPIAAAESGSRRRRLNRIVKAAMIAGLLGAGWFAQHVVEFHVPTSIADALPRV